MFWLPIPTLIYRWEISLFPGSVCPYSQICGPIRGIIAHRHMNVNIGAEAVQFPEQEDINGIFVAVQRNHWPMTCILILKDNLLCFLLVYVEWRPSVWKLKMYLQKFPFIWHSVFMLNLFACLTFLWWMRKRWRYPAYLASVYEGRATKNEVSLMLGDGKYKISKLGQKGTHR